MDYTIYHSDGSWFMTVNCSEESLTDMIPEGGFHVDGVQHVLSTCVDGTLSIPTETQINNFDNVEAFSSVRAYRNDLLAKSDWTQMNDSPLSGSLKTQWQTYRQQLRDMPQADGFDPLNPTWPTSP